MRSKIKLLKSWKLEKIILPKITLRKANNIIESLDGDVEVIFDRNKEIEENKSSPRALIFSVKGIYMHGIYTYEPSFSEIEFKVNIL